MATIGYNLIMLRSTAQLQLFPTTNLALGAFGVGILTIRVGRRFLANSF